MRIPDLTPKRLSMQLRRNTGRLATTDLYFVNACAGLIRRFHRRGPIRVLGPNCFAAGDIALIIRRDYPWVVNKVLSRPWKKLIYLIDDDIEAGMNEPGLPQAYRIRLKHLYITQYQPILHSAHAVVTGSQQLAEKYGHIRQTYQIGPYWSAPLAQSGHYDSLLNGDPLKIVHLGTASHRADLEFILPAVERIMSRHDKLELTLFYRTPELERMAKRLNIRIRNHQTWSQHKHVLQKERFHVALYPTLDTRFNNARSVNKLIEHGVVGSVGLYSAGWQHAHYIKQGENGFLVDNRLSDWEVMIEHTLSHKEMLREVYERSRETSERLNNKDKQIRFWSKMFELEAPD